MARIFRRGKVSASQKIVSQKRNAKTGKFFHVTKRANFTFKSILRMSLDGIEKLNPNKTKDSDKKKKK